MADTPHLIFPMSIMGSSFAVAEQDTLSDIASCVIVAALTPRGTRPLNEDFGTDDLPFILESDVGDVVAKVSQSEPRARILTDEQFSASDPFDLVINMQISSSRTSA